MRIAIAALLVVHGLIHLLGFLKPWKLAAVPQLTGQSIIPLSEAAARVVGVIWLATAVVLIAAAVLRVADHEAWWLPAAIGIVCSQALVILQWSDAKAGTLPNLLLVVPVIAGAAIARFHQTSAVHAEALLASASPSYAILERAELDPLPAPVRRWLEASGAIGRPRAQTVRLRQRGEMRTGPGEPFIHAEAQQYFTIDKPAFVWTIDLTMKGLLPVVGRDSYVDGHGRMFIQIAGLITVADGTGEKFDQGTMLRFLGEIIWFPSAALAPYLHWTPVDERRARVVMSYRGIEASALFEFDDRGRLVQLSAKRYYNGDTLEDWVIPVTEWKTIRGIEIPTRGSAIWKLAAGDFDYYRWEILDVESNRPELW